jgi:hypothetical protein
MHLLPGFVFPASLTHPVIGAFPSDPVLFIPSTSHSATHLTSVPCLKILRTTSHILSASLIIASSTKAGITRILLSIDRELSLTEVTMWKSWYALC